MICVVDYGRGNLFSLGEALRHVGADFRISTRGEDVTAAEKILLPGVGAFGDCMFGLRERDLIGPLKEAAARQTPILGICVGCQVLLSEGEEFGAHKGLDIVRGAVRRLPPPRKGDPDAVRIPNVGWHRVEFVPGDPTFDAIGPESTLYFVHSYAPVPELAEAVTATIVVNGKRVPVAVRHGEIEGFQFHPEKSGSAGLALLRRFIGRERRGSGKASAIA
jgi:glutamine amidotransferase